MQLRYFFFVGFLFFCFPKLDAQPQPCEEPAEMTPTCLEACIICNIDGFTGRHESDISGEAPDDFCTFTVHNAQWIAFIAGSEELVIDLAVSNCQIGAGLEVAIYEAIDCENYQLISNCFGGMNMPISPGTSRQVTVNQPLVIGQYYYLVMDGAFGDNCDWTFTVVQGNTQVSPLTTSGEILGPASACPELPATYTTTGEEGATLFEWTLNGQVVGNEMEVEIQWPGPGSYQLCVQAANACDEAPPSCRQIAVNPYPPQLFEETICASDCFVLNDSTELCEQGFYEFNFVTQQGCDSLVYVDLTVFETGATELAAQICSGDSLFIGNTPYFTTGQHTEVLQNYLGCDSIVTLDLLMIICEIEGLSTPFTPTCHGEASGRIEFSVTNGTPIFFYNWERLGGAEEGMGTITQLNEVIEIDNLPAGTYLINVFDVFGNELVLIEYVTEPPPIVADIGVSDYNGVNVSCFGASDGSLSATTSGGVPPFDFLWSTGGVSSTITMLSAGDYAVQLTDAIGCVLELERTIEEPSPLSLDANFIDPGCEGFSSGYVEVIGTEGGIAPYRYALNGAAFSEAGLFTELANGDYSLSVLDTNNCTVEVTGSLAGRIIPVLEVPGLQTTELAEPIQLSVTANVLLDSVSWTPVEELSCVNCPRPLATPVTNTTYIVGVTSEDGCTTFDSIQVEVLEVYDVFVPNAFSPNFDGINDNFVLYGGPEVATVLRFSVFDRWGNEQYRATNFPVNETKFGWDGRTNGQEASQGIYAWFAELEFINGQRRVYEGDVLLVR